MNDDDDVARRRMKPGPREGFRWDKGAIIYAIDLWHRQHLRAPAIRDWSRAGENHPSRITVTRHFGSWNAAICAAGLRPRLRGETLARRHGLGDLDRSAA